MRKVNKVKVKNITLGDGSIYVQSMLNVISDDIAGNVAQAKALKDAGADIIRVAIPDKNAVRLIDAIKSAVDIPLVADIHFDYKLALESVNAGADKIRINPGNIGGEDRVKAVCVKCGNAGVPIRVGVNGGSLEKNILLKYGHPTPEALVESACYHTELLHRYDFDNIVVSLKSSNVQDMIRAYTLMAQKPYPLHLGVTEAGTAGMGMIRSAIGIGSLLASGIGETIRVSLTADPIEEIYAAKNILKALNLDNSAARLISCPTCGRTKIDLIKLAGEVEKATMRIKKPITIAVMGCVVNGPGEASEADIGIAGGDGCAVLFKKGKVVRKIPENEILSQLLKEIEEIT